jgi:hypothetical protein
MSIISTSFKIKRVAAIGSLVAIGAFVLFLFLASLGDSDLPPYDPPFPWEHAGWVMLGVIAWPLDLLARKLGHYPPGFLWLPLFFLAGLFWASLIELYIALKPRRRA